jgi:SAM-dependent methyltransferase
MAESSPRAAALAPYRGLFTDYVREARLAAALSHVLPASRVLDVGCGLADLADRFSEYMGCDRNPLILEENRRRFPGASYVSWDVSDGEPPPVLLAGRRFDAVLMLALLEHLAAPWRALARAAALLAPGGRVVVTTPHPLGRIPLELGAALGWLAPHAAEEHEMLLARKDLEASGVRAGLRLLRYRRFLLGLNQVAVFAAA